MAQYEYKVIAAPTKGTKAKGVKTAEDRFAHMLQELMNELGAEGWEFQRAETLPSVERAGLTGSTTNWRHVLVFRRLLAAQENAVSDLQASVAAPAAMAASAAAAMAEPRLTAEEPHPAGQPGATQMLEDNGVEETSEVSGMTDSLSNLAEARKSS